MGIERHCLAADPVDADIGVPGHRHGDRPHRAGVREDVVPEERGDHHRSIGKGKLVHVQRGVLAEGQGELAHLEAQVRGQGLAVDERLLHMDDHVGRV